MLPILAIDIGGTKIAAALVYPNDQLTQHIKISTSSSSTSDDLRHSLKKIITHFTAPFVCIAVACTGIIHNGILTALNPNNLGGLKNFPLQAYIQSLTAVPCFCLNDAQAAAWAEFDHRKNQVNDLTFITVSTGVGGGIIQNRQLITGQRNLAGHLGHIQSDPNGPICGCGRVGCVEAIASGKAIAKQATQELEGLEAKAIFEQYFTNNQQAKQIIERSAQAIANLAVDVKAMIDADCIVLGGSVGLADGYLALVNHYLQQQPQALQIDVFCAHHLHDAGLLGAALWARTMHL